MPRLTLSFLGCFHVCLDDRPVTDFKSNKVRALLAYLAVEADRPHRREALAGLLWPDRADRDALSNLRYALASLRRSIGDHVATPPFLLITPQTIQFNPGSDYWLDVAELERQIADSSKQIPAQSLCRGSFLAGFSIGDASPFEEWALLRREQISLQVMSLLGNLAAYHETRGDYPAAQAYARQQVALEPWSEEAHRTLMRVLTLDGQRNAALHQYYTCRDLLRDELGVEPTEETTALYEAIRAGILVDRRKSREAGKASPSPLSACLLVSQVLPFVAREEQLERLASFLQGTLAGAGRVVFITGEAGAAKPLCSMNLPGRRCRPTPTWWWPAATATPPPASATLICPSAKSCSCSAATSKRNGRGQP